MPPPGSGPTRARPSPTTRRASRRWSTRAGSTSTPAVNWNAWRCLADLCRDSHRIVLRRGTYLRHTDVVKYVQDAVQEVSGAAARPVSGSAGAPEHGHHSERGTRARVARLV